MGFLPAVAIASAAQAADAPTVTSVTPSSGSALGGSDVVIKGTGFSSDDGATDVYFGTIAVDVGDVNVVSDTEIDVTTPADAADEDGDDVVDVVVTTPDGGASATSSADKFTYSTNIPVMPTVTSVAPATGTSAGGTAVVLTGTAFTGATAVDFGTVAATTFTVVSDTEIDVTSPADSAPSASHVVDVRVTTAGGVSAVGSGDTFTYTTVPTVTSLSPSSGSSAGGTVVTVTGAGFAASGTTVAFGTTPGTKVVVASPTSLTVTTPAHSAGVVDVTVTTSAGTSSTSAADKYTFQQALTSVVAVEGTSHNLYVSMGGAGFKNYGGILLGSPAVISSSSGRNYYIVRGSNNDLYVRTDTSGFTHLHPSSPLVCTTAPGASTDGANYLIGCVGSNRILYTMSGALPASGNPVASTVARASSFQLNSDTTAVKGGVGGVQDGLALAATGPTYPAGTDEAGDSFIAGNTFLFDPSEGPDAAAIGGSCAYAPSLVVTSEGDVLSLACHSSTSADTVVYRTTVGDDGTSSTRGFDLHGVSLGGTGSVPTATENGIVVYVTGTNRSLYTATLGDAYPMTPSAYSIFSRYPAAGAALSGPGASIGQIPVAPAVVAKGLRHFARAARS